MPATTFPTGAVLVFGASGGVGQGVARSFALAGADLALVGHRHPESVVALADEADALGRKLSRHAVDVTDHDAVAAVVADAVAAHGRIHTVVWAVGPVVEQGLIGDVDPAAWRRAIEVETHGFFTIVQATLPHLRTHGGGSYVHLGSAGAQAYPLRDGLSVIPKAANEALCRAIAKEEGRHGIRANSVLLGVIDAGMFHELSQRGVFDAKWVDATLQRLALRRWGTPAEVGQTAVFLATNGYVTGQQISVSGGYGL